MNNEIYNLDCASYSQTHKDYSEMSQVTDDLVELVKRLAYLLRKASPDNKLPEKALDYLQRKGLSGSPLRDGVS